ncbi:pro-pol polyprotein [Plakobranchus ocellatus]|uniref:Pro-pol polyprotein n=1 Tax=Plakobranchus ocellatus TaxID=259542 RepID=A0AAV3Y6C1_9GAST|nr:pro-pol polyprotein [Plakobranchus ocellatus]
MCPSTRHSKEEVSDNGTSLRLLENAIWNDELGSNHDPRLIMLVRGMDHKVDYLDDPLVYTPTREDHVKILREFFRRLQRANFTVRPTKSTRGARTIDFLGSSAWRTRNQLSGRESRKSSRCIGAQDQEGGSCIFYLVIYYKEFLPNYAEISESLYDLVRIVQLDPVTYGDAQERAYNL